MSVKVIKIITHNTFLHKNLQVIENQKFKFTLFYIYTFLINSKLLFAIIEGQGQKEPS